VANNRVTLFQRDGLTRVPLGPALDLARLHARLGHDHVVIAQLAQLFVEDSVHLVAECTQAIAAGRLAAGIRSAYTLRTSSENLAAADLAAAAEGLERALRANDLARATISLQEVSAELSRLHGYLMAVVNERMNRPSGSGAQG
jgi:HPt (histidine-containing phosphotransfer) domain-containing protein